LRRRPRATSSGWLAVALALGCGGLATAGRMRLDPETLAAALAGRYDSSAQAQAELRAGSADPHEPLALLIARVSAPLVADVVFFVQESAADDPRRVFAQRIWVLGVDSRHQVVHGVYRFAEPERWRAGAASPELFSALLVRDLEPVAGCDVHWSRTARGFRGVNDPKSCRSSRDDGSALHFEQVLELEGEGLALSEREIDARGVSVRGRDASSPYLFRRRSDPASANRP
jgi:hypothetical protein